MNTIWLTVQITQGRFDKLQWDYLISILLLWSNTKFIMPSSLLCSSCSSFFLVEEKSLWGRWRIESDWNISGVQWLAPPKTIAQQKASCESLKRKKTSHILNKLTSFTTESQIQEICKCLFKFHSIFHSSTFLWFTLLAFFIKLQNSNHVQQPFTLKLAVRQGHNINRGKCIYT